MGAILPSFIRITAGTLEPHGDWEVRSNFGRPLLVAPGFLSCGELDVGRDLAFLQELDETTSRSLGRAYGWGFLGNIVLGPAGLLSGLAFGGQRHRTLFAAQLVDGRRFIAECDADVFEKIRRAWRKSHPEPP